MLPGAEKQKIPPRSDTALSVHTKNEREMQPKISVDCAQREKGKAFIRRSTGGPLRPEAAEALL